MPDRPDIPEELIEHLAAVRRERVRGDTLPWADLPEIAKAPIRAQAADDLSLVAPALCKQGAEEERERLLGDQKSQSSDEEPSREFPDEIGIERLMRRGREVDFVTRSAERAKSGSPVYAGADLRLYVPRNQARSKGAEEERERIEVALAEADRALTAWHADEPFYDPGSDSSEPFTRTKDQIEKLTEVCPKCEGEGCPVCNDTGKELSSRLRASLQGTGKQPPAEPQGDVVEVAAAWIYGRLMKERKRYNRSSDDWPENVFPEFREGWRAEARDLVSKLTPLLALEVKERLEKAAKELTDTAQTPEERALVSVSSSLVLAALDTPAPSESATASAFRSVLEAIVENSDDPSAADEAQSALAAHPAPSESGGGE